MPQCHDAGSVPKESTMNHQRYRSSASGLLAAAFLLIGLASGCQQWSTYPPVELTARLQRPAAEPVPTVIAESIRYAREKFLDGRDLPINLPQGVSAAVYDKVFAHLGGGRPMQAAGESAIHITEVRTRAMNAQVDMIYPRADGIHQFVTLTLEHGMFEKWRVVRSKPWVMRDVVPPGPNYVSPPPEQPKN
jgi:hypothetical protein